MSASPMSLLWLEGFPPPTVIQNELQIFEGPKEKVISCWTGDNASADFTDIPTRPQSFQDLAKVRFPFESDFLVFCIFATLTKTEEQRKD